MKSRRSFICVLQTLPAVVIMPTMRSNSEKKSLRSLSAKPVDVMNTCLYQGFVSSDDAHEAPLACTHFQFSGSQAIGGSLIVIGDSSCARAGSDIVATSATSAHCSKRFFSVDPARSLMAFPPYRPARR